MSIKRYQQYVILRMIITNITFLELSYYIQMMASCFGKLRAIRQWKNIYNAFFLRLKVLTQ